MGRKGPRAKTKTVLKPVNKKEQLGGMPKMKKDKNLNKNPPSAALSGNWLATVLSFKNLSNRESPKASYYKVHSSLPMRTTLFGGC